MSQNIKSNGFAPHLAKEPEKHVTVTLGRPYEHPFAERWPDGAEIIERDGGVYVRIPVPHNGPGTLTGAGAIFTEMRVDSRDDAARLARGNSPWYAERLAAAKKAKA